VDGEGKGQQEQKAEDDPHGEPPGNETGSVRSIPSSTREQAAYFRCLAINSLTAGTSSRGISMTV
jgi:hypothetical protein